MPNIEHDRPHFELRQIPVTGAPGPVEIYSLDQLPAQAANLHLGRREMLILAGLTSGVLFTAACTPTQTPTVRPTRSPVAAPALPSPSPTQPPTQVPTKTPIKANTAPPRPTPANSQTAQAVVERNLTCGDLNATADKVGFSAFSPDSSLLAVKDVGPLVRLWKTSSGELLHTFSVETEAFGVGFSSDGTLLAAGNKAGLIFIWQVSNYKEVARIDTHENSPRDIYFSPDNQQLLVSSINKIQVWTIKPAAKISEITTGGAQPAVLSPNGKIIAYANPQPKNAAYDIVLKTFPDGPVLRTLQGPTASIIWLAFSPDSQMVAATSIAAESTVHVWQVSESKPRYTFSFKTDKATVWWVGFSTDGKWLGASGSSLFLYSTADGKLSREVPLDKRWQYANPNPGLNLLARVKDNRISLWNIDMAADDLGVCLFDKDATPKDASAITFQQTDAAGITRTYTLPCGAPVPAGAVCTCNCVPGSGLTSPAVKPPTCSCVSNVTSPGSCSCNKVCTCIPVRKYCFVMFKPEAPV